ncbi:MAG: NAD(P)/FAD-dependent oxidoreductase [Nitrososphaeraceae archaeon]|nr:NAD(P)/FAD-dependent oxidoreductase [Nitrososphaeraceae archaeon]MBV9668349.1 NAD(P)/FAD-dependent oxidoreductase [Nitrososphaeraceae archaeon]
MADYYDIIVAGGSISGLLAAREAAATGLSVVVLEEDTEIGTPEHCGGLVSINGIKNLGIMPSSNAIENNSIKYAKIFSPSKSFELNAEKQKVVVLDRRTFDKQIAFQAQKIGAEIRTKCSMHSISKRNNTDNSNSDNSYYIIKTSEGLLTCNYFIDARGIGSLIKHNRQGLLQSAQYEVYASWIDRNTIEISFDRERYPGFFAWIIPTGSGKGKVGVAGRSINAANSLKSYMEGKGEKYSVVRKVYAPIWIMGPLEHFVIDRSMVIGDAAGQTKPTTAGGIYTCGIGGILAGKALTKSIEKNDRNLMYYYERKWFSIFKSEFDKMLILRKVLERLDNRAIDKILSTISQGEIDDISKTGDFDFHSTALSRILHSTISLKIAKTIFDNEIRRLINF